MSENKIGRQSQRTAVKAEEFEVADVIEIGNRKGTNEPIPKQQ